MRLERVSLAVVAFAAVVVGTSARTQAQPIQLAQAESRAASMTVYVDRALNQKDEQEAGESGGGGIVLYDQDRSGGTIKLRPQIFPDSPSFNLLARWMGTARVTVENPELAYGTANIVVDIKNNSTQQLQVVDGYLEVAESMTDRRPFITLTSEFDAMCGTDPSKFNPKFTFWNTGWSRVQNARLQYKFTAADGQGAETSPPLATNVGTFLDSAEASVADGLRSLGVDVKRLQTLRPTCGSVAGVPQCLAALFKQGALGKLPTQSVRRADADLNSPAASTIVADVTGDILYSWTDAKGAMQEGKNPFGVTIPLFKFRIKNPIEAECGAGGPSDPSHPKMKLKLDEANYRLPIQYRTTLEAGQNKRLGLSLYADKSSQHSFRAVLRLSDSSIVRSAPIELRYFVARAKDAAP